MSSFSFIGDNTFLIAIAVVGGFVLWKFVIEPIMNQGRPIEPTEEDVKTFGEKMQENLKTGTDI